MAGATVDVATTTDGTLIIQLHGTLDADDAVELRATLVHAVRRLRPLRLVLDLHDVQALDAINVGTLAAACQLGDDHGVAVFVEAASRKIAEKLTKAGVPRHRLREAPPLPLAS